jgi:hypothetical protein
MNVGLEFEILLYGNRYCDNICKIPFREPLYRTTSLFSEVINGCAWQRLSARRAQVFIGIFRSGYLSDSKEPPENYK